MEELIGLESSRDLIAGLKRHSLSSLQRSEDLAPCLEQQAERGSLGGLCDLWQANRDAKSRIEPKIFPLNNTVMLHFHASVVITWGLVQHTLLAWRALGHIVLSHGIREEWQGERA